MREYDNNTLIDDYDFVIVDILAVMVATRDAGSIDTKVMFCDTLPRTQLDPTLCGLVFFLQILKYCTLENFK